MKNPTVNKCQIKLVQQSGQNYRNKHKTEHLMERVRGLQKELLHLTSSEDFILRQVHALYRLTVCKLLDSYWIACKPTKAKQLIECQEKNYLEYTQHAIGRMTHRFCVIIKFDSDS